MADDHQLHTLIAKVICEALSHDPERAIGPEEAKQTSKCIIDALDSAGFQISLKNQLPGK
jgi:hypothetical protein